MARKSVKQFIYKSENNQIINVLGEKNSHIINFLSIISSLITIGLFIPGISKEMIITKYYIIAIIYLTCCIGNYTMVILYVRFLQDFISGSNSKDLVKYFPVKITTLASTIGLWLIEYDTISEMARQVNILTYPPLAFIVLERASLIFSLLLFATLMYGFLFKNNSWRACIREYKAVVFISYIGWSMSFLALLILCLYF